MKIQLDVFASICNTISNILFTVLLPFSPNNLLLTSLPPFSLNNCQFYKIYYYIFNNLLYSWYQNQILFNFWYLCYIFLQNLNVLQQKTCHTLIAIYLYKETEEESCKFNMI